MKIINQEYLITTKKWVNTTNLSDERIEEAIQIASDHLMKKTNYDIQRDVMSGKLNLVNDLLTPVDATDMEQVIKCEAILSATFLMVKFALMTGYDFVSGSISHSIGQESYNENINFQESLQLIENHITDLINQFYKRKWTSSNINTTPKFDLSYYDNSEWVKGEDKFMTYKTFIESITDPNIITGDNGIEIVKKDPTNSLMGIYIRMSEAKLNAILDAKITEIAFGFLGSIEITSFVDIATKINEFNSGLDLITNEGNVINKGNTSKGQTISFTPSSLSTLRYLELGIIEFNQLTGSTQLKIYTNNNEEELLINNILQELNQKVNEDYFLQEIANLESEITNLEQNVIFNKNGTTTLPDDYVATLPKQVMTLDQTTTNITNAINTNNDLKDPVNAYSYTTAVEFNSMKQDIARISQFADKQINLTDRQFTKIGNDTLTYTFQSGENMSIFTSDKSIFAQLIWVKLPKPEELTFEDTFNNGQTTQNTFNGNPIDVEITTTTITITGLTTQDQNSLWNNFRIRRMFQTGSVSASIDTIARSEITRVENKFDTITTETNSLKQNKATNLNGFSSKTIEANLLELKEAIDFKKESSVLDLTMLGVITQKTLYDAIKAKWPNLNDALYKTVKVERSINIILIAEITSITTTSLFLKGENYYNGTSTSGNQKVYASITYNSTSNITTNYLRAQGANGTTSNDYVTYNQLQTKQNLLNEANLTTTTKNVIDAINELKNAISLLQATKTETIYKLVFIDSTLSIGNTVTRTLTGGWVNDFIVSWNIAQENGANANSYANHNLYSTYDVDGSNAITIIEAGASRVANSFRITNEGAGTSTITLDTTRTGRTDNTKIGRVVVQVRKTIKVPV